MLTEIPLVGQPYTLKGWFATLMVVCNCEAHEPVLIVGNIGAMGKCSKCSRVFQLQAMNTNTQTGQITFAIGLGTAAPEPVQSPLTAQ